MKSALLRTLPLAALFALAGCETTTNAYNVSDFEKQFYEGCATEPPQNPTCGHH